MRLRLTAVLLTLAACAPGKAEVDLDPLADDDSGLDLGDDEDKPDPDGDPDEEDPDEDEDPDEEEPDEDVYPLGWAEWRFFEFEFGCEAEVGGQGIEVTQEEGIEVLFDACPECERFFEVSTDRDSICDDWGGLPVSNPYYRGIRGYGTDAVDIYLIAEGRGGIFAEFIATAERDNDGTLRYEYGGELGGGAGDYEVEGLLSIEPF